MPNRSACSRRARAGNPQGTPQEHSEEHEDQHAEDVPEQLVVDGGDVEIVAEEPVGNEGDEIVADEPADDDDEPPVHEPLPLECLLDTLQPPMTSLHTS